MGKVGQNMDIVNLQSMDMTNSKHFQKYYIIFIWKPVLRIYNLKQIL
jgi:hypothetical protein